MGVIPRLVTDEENERLISMPEESEIKNVIFSMPNSKTPGPDGFSASFFNIFWATVGADVVDVIQDFFSSGTMPRGLNHTFIALIPKGEGSSRLSQFRPISFLIFVFYKAISKIMTNL